MKVLLVNGSKQYKRLITDVLKMEAVSTLEEADLVMFTGGADVSPDLYGAKQHPYTFNDRMRDIEEREIFQLAKVMDIPMVGICRGAQFLNVMCGGQMYQHVGSHTQDHYLTDVDSGREVYVTSTHHQMMKPAENAIIVAVSNLGGEREWYEGSVFKRDVSNTDYEVVFYPYEKCLCFQPHPEFEGEEYGDMKQYFRSLVHSHLVELEPV